ncbi:anaphase-promoting complex subunit 15B-like isoform X1 [Teleopsis dalmanni]|uniref:anaphase-promoting complex subunit 15B-like isoform X1 n=1 Tax=Teleopsis dalmanni TaxID=139649 RepID=UPI0018CEB883|nr:anaphase-promoting complex subunit 15B-like isoform X1 [Teleopsis dalmanni]XP_037940960.1 anaphase-promoting complex subunit 15B-like isoform X1 [Teleopsis dalmanni]
MSMIPFFPSLRPQVANRIWFHVDLPIDESEVLRSEREHHNWLDSIKNIASDLHPLGRIVTLPGPETDDEDDAAANDDSDDTDSHEDEDDDTHDHGNQTDRTALGLYSPADDMNNTVPPLTDAQ